MYCQEDVSRTSFTLSPVKLGSRHSTKAYRTARRATIVLQADHDSRLAEVAQHASNLEICFKLGRHGLYQQVMEKGEHRCFSASGSLFWSTLGFQVRIFMPSVSSTCGQLIEKDWRRPAHFAIRFGSRFQDTMSLSLGLGVPRGSAIHHLKRHGAVESWCRPVDCSGVSHAVLRLGAYMR